MGLWGSADMGPGRHGDGPKWVETGRAETGWDEMGRADAGKTPATQSRKFENKSNKMRI